MRACTKCGEVKPLEAFPPVRRGEPKLQTWCRDCFAAYGAEYYRKNREAQKARLLRNATARRNDNRLCAIAYLRTHPCVDCGEMDIVVLQFDHLRDKKVDVARMINSGSTWEAIEREIGKCEVRCANCHRLATARRYAERKAPAVRRSTAPEQLGRRRNDAHLPGMQEGTASDRVRLSLEETRHSPLDLPVLPTGSCSRLVPAPRSRREAGEWIWRTYPAAQRRSS
jgi:hypothetical protein